MKNKDNPFRTFFVSIEEQLPFLALISRKAFSSKNKKTIAENCLDKHE